MVYGLTNKVMLKIKQIFKNDIVFHFTVVVQTQV